MLRRIVLLAALIAASIPATAAAQAPAPATPAREVVQLRGDLYVVRGGTHNTVAYVTPDGIILGDPISTEVATWLKAELQRRFNKPVVHVVYSHHDFDHAEGAAVFGQPTIWAHENVVKNLDGRLHRLAGGFTDANGNGRLERAEAGGGYGRNFDRLDRNKDGAVTAAEMNQEIVKPSRTYADRTTITLGGKTVQLLHPGRNHSDDMTVMFFPAERVAFGVDFLSPGGTPSAAGNYDGTPLAEWIASIKVVEALDIDVFANGHGRAGTKADLTANRRFLEDVAAAVQQGITEGRDLDELKKTITLDAYSAWPNFATARLAHIEAAFNNLAASPDQFRSELSVSVLGSVVKPGMYRVKKGMPIRELLQLAGGASAQADLSALRLMRIVGFNRREYDVKEGDVFLHNDTLIVPRKP